MRAPLTPKQLHHHQTHGDTRVDHYHWLKDSENPEVIALLNAENAYTEHVMAPVKALQEQLYTETLSRIQETDQDAPWPYKQHEYYFRTVAGQEHEIFCRRLQGSDQEEILFDENIHAKNHDYFEVGGYELSPDDRWLALTVDDTGDEIYDVWLLDLTNMKLKKQVIKDVSENIVFSLEPNVLWVTRFDDTHRPYQVWSCDLLHNSSLLIFEEPDERYWLAIYRSDSDRYLMVQCASKLTGEVHYV
jgi:oligopeptidase B